MISQGNPRLLLNRFQSYQSLTRIILQLKIVDPQKRNLVYLRHYDLQGRFNDR